MVAKVSHNNIHKYTLKYLTRFLAIVFGSSKRSNGTLTEKRAARKSRVLELSMLHPHTVSTGKPENH